MEEQPETAAELLIGVGIEAVEVALKRLGIKHPEIPELMLELLRAKASDPAVVRLRSPRASAEQMAEMERADAWLARHTVAKALRRRG